jgi:hypothetical protein
MTSIGPDNALPRFQKQLGPKVLNYLKTGQFDKGCDNVADEVCASVGVWDRF